MNDSFDVRVRQASVSDLDALAPLFDSYRQFYGRPGDIALARRFLLERFQHRQSVIFIATGHDGAAVGFTQLYPTFSSISAAQAFILNDLFVAKQARSCGVGKKLLHAAATFGRAAGAVSLTLSTARDNNVAQDLYVSQGWVRDIDFYTYSLSL